MDLLALIAIVVAAAAAGRAVGRVAVSNGGFGLGELFRTSHELGWPVGVQEDDGPVGWGAKVGAMSALIAAEAELAAEEPIAHSDEGHATTEHVAPHRQQAWRVVLRGGSMAAGSARR